MSDEKTDESNAKGKEDNNSVTENKENNSEVNKFKASNDELEKELTRRKELREEYQKLEEEKVLGGKTIAGHRKKTKEELLKEKAKEEAGNIANAFR